MSWGHALFDGACFSFLLFIEEFLLISRGFPENLFWIVGRSIA